MHRTPVRRQACSRSHESCTAHKTPAQADAAPPVTQSSHTHTGIHTRAPLAQPAVCNQPPTSSRHDAAAMQKQKPHHPNPTPPVQKASQHTSAPKARHRPPPACRKPPGRHPPPQIHKSASTAKAFLNPRHAARPMSQPPLPKPTHARRIASSLARLRAAPGGVRAPLQCFGMLPDVQPHSRQRAPTPCCCRQAELYKPAHAAGGGSPHSQKHALKRTREEEQPTALCMRRPGRTNHTPCDCLRHLLLLLLRQLMGSARGCRKRQRQLLQGE